MALPDPTPTPQMDHQSLVLPREIKELKVINPSSSSSSDPNRSSREDPPPPRRKNRRDNDRFTHHPFAILNPIDLPAPGYPREAPTFHFTPDLIDLPLEPAHPEVKFPPSSSSRSSSSSSIPRLHRGLPPPPRRRAHKDHVQEMEEHIRAFAYALPDSLYADSWNLMESPSPMEEEEEGAEELDYIPISSSSSSSQSPQDKTTAAGGTVMVWDLPTPFTRLILHTLCAWYGLASGSKGPDLVLLC
ncbi:MAG: hypothetical protein DHS80DRAFT_33672 [Piptocephalis tieghemiana]|nr:MAG: hypothetical protein DHS80DRAFT_33672 [Piptocephalis tieghemiana]